MIFKNIYIPPKFELTASQNCLIVFTSSNLLDGFVALRKYFFKCIPGIQSQML